MEDESAQPGQERSEECSVNGATPSRHLFWTAQAATLACVHHDREDDHAQPQDEDHEPADVVKTENHAGGIYALRGSFPNTGPCERDLAREPDAGDDPTECSLTAGEVRATYHGIYADNLGRRRQPHPGTDGFGSFAAADQN